MRNILLIISLFILIACDKHSDSIEGNQEYILFGRFAGFCVGEQCIEIYKLTTDALYEDKSDQYPSYSDPYSGDFVKLSNEKFELVKYLANKIPDQLIAANDTIIGAPDVTDGGGVYFAITNGSKTRFWLIDQFDSNIPEYLIPFKSEINQAVSIIND
jgi:hypothetical protein